MTIQSQSQSQTDDSSITSPATTTTSGAELVALVSEITDFLAKVEARLGPDAPAITSAEKRRRSKPRKGAEKVLTVIAPIVQQHRLDSPGLSTAEMLAQHAIAQALVPLQARLQKIAKRVSDEAFDAQTGSWEMGLQFYALLQRRAKTDGSLGQAIAPLAQMFAHRHPLVKASRPTKVQTRVKAKLKAAMALAERHGVATEGEAPVSPSAPSGS